MMRNSIVILIFLMVAGACTKKEVSSVSFNVTTVSTLYNVGDTVNFIMSGNPDYIVFYSGENGHRYQNRNRISVIGGIPILSFLSYEQYTRDTTTNSLHLLVSKDFNGNYDSSAVDSATWIDISNRATLSTGKSNTTSGNINLSDFVSQDTPVYLAFKYTDQQNGVNYQRNWTITNLALINYLPDSSTTTLLNISSSNTWLSVNTSGTSVNWGVTNSYLKIAGGSPTVPSNEVYLISKPVNLTAVLPDTGIPLKTISDNPLQIYPYIFTKSGTYTVTFDARNANVYSGTSTTKTIILTIK